MIAARYLSLKNLWVIAILAISRFSQSCAEKGQPSLSFPTRQQHASVRSRLPSPLQIPRGGAPATVTKVFSSVDPKMVATVGLSCLASHCLADLLIPSKVVNELYQLDSRRPKMDEFYTSRVGGWLLAAVGSILLQLHTKLSFAEALGYSFLPIVGLTLYQLISGKYDEADVNRNNGIVAIVFQVIHCFVCGFSGKIPTHLSKLWIQSYMATIGLLGLNLLVSAQTIPTICPATITVLRVLGSVLLAASTSVLSQYRAIGLPKSAGVLLAALAVSSIPVAFDLKQASKTKDSKPCQLYAIFVLLELAAAAYLLR